MSEKFIPIFCFLGREGSAYGPVSKLAQPKKKKKDDVLFPHIPRSARTGVPIQISVYSVMKCNAGDRDRGEGYESVCSVPWMGLSRVREPPAPVGPYTVSEGLTVHGYDK